MDPTYLVRLYNITQKITNSELLVKQAMITLQEMADLIAYIPDQRPLPLSTYKRRTEQGMLEVLSIPSVTFIEKN